MRLRDPVAARKITVRALRPGEVPEPIRSAGAFQRLDYADIATLRTPHAARWSVEQWTRAIVERGATAQRVGPFVWTRVVGLRMGPRATPDHVAGWRVGARGDDWIRLEASSWHLTVHPVVHVTAEHVSLSLLVRYDRAPATVLGPPIALLHRRGIPQLLREAEQLLVREEG
jgi:hypothetical protein